MHNYTLYSMIIHLQKTLDRTPQPCYTNSSKRDREERHTNDQEHGADHRAQPQAHDDKEGLQGVAQTATHACVNEHRYTGAQKHQGLQQTAREAQHQEGGRTACVTSSKR